MKTACLVILLFTAYISGCISAKVSGTGINAQDSMHYVNVQANSFNAEVSTNAPRNF